METIRLLILTAAAVTAQPFLKSELIFTPEHWHNHSSSITELPNGDFFVSWFHGSGERQSDDVKIEGARWRKATQTWSKRFDLADTPGFPDTNCVVWVDSKKRLWLFWPTILANTWESALMKYRISTDFQQQEGPPKWDWQDNILLIPKRMQERTQEVFEKELKRNGPLKDWASRMVALAGDKQFSRLGWFSRTHPIELPNGRIIVPLYSDGFSFGLMAISDDAGKSWHASEPIVGFGNIQPSVVRKKNGDLVAYMRDNGPAPKRIMKSVSKDSGETWSPAEDTELFNPGTSVEAIAMKDGRWVIAYNDVEKTRTSLAVSMSDDEGQTWKWKRNMDRGAGSYHYPSLIQAADGTLHLTYSLFETKDGKQEKSIKHAHFNSAWIEEGGLAAAAPEYKDGYADSNGVRIHYVATGAGPLVVMIHGFPDFWYTWRHQMEALSSQYQVAAIDLRGYNLSDKPAGEENYDMRLLIGDVAAVIKSLGREKAIIAGHDWGGAISWQFAFQMPQMVEKLIILNLPHPNGLSRELAGNAKQQANSAYARRFQSPDSHRALTAESLAGWVKDPAAKAKYIEAFARSDFNAMMNYYRRNYPKEPYEARVAPQRLNVPVLMIHGLKDTALLAPALNNTWDWLDADLTLVTIPNASHFVQQDASDLVSKSIKAWLNR